jgi:hypothetical protein
MFSIGKNQVCPLTIYRAPSPFDLLIYQFDEPIYRTPSNYRIFDVDESSNLPNTGYITFYSYCL